MKKTCSVCGKVKDMLSWEDTCFSCQREQYYRDIKEQIQSGETDRTDSEDEIICPIIKPGERYNRYPNSLTNVVEMLTEMRKKIKDGVTNG